MANTNIINAVFGSGICAVTTSAFRANYGMVLRFSGIDLPTAFECDFSNYDVSGKDSVTAIGQNNEVQIPDDLWDSGLNIYAYVYLHPTDDSGVTVYTVTIPVLGRPNRTEEEPTPHEQTVIEQAISALNDAVEQTAADVETTTANAQAAAQSEANASASERSAAASASAALASQNAAESAAQSATESASGASESARNAAQSASQAAQSATAAQESAEQAERSVQSITDDVERAERAANTATGKATEAASSAATASTKAAQAEQSATAAAQSASSAASAAQNAAASEQLAESHATDAEQAKSDAQDAKDAAETAQAAAEQAAESVSGLSEQIEQNTADIADLVQSKAGALIDTASGSIASFVPDATIPTVKGLTVNIEPVQDLHGYDAPWPAGGGKNKFPITMSTHTANGTTFTVLDDGTIRISGTPTAQARATISNVVYSGIGDMVATVNGTTGIRLFCRKRESGTNTYPTLSNGSVLSTDTAIFDQFVLEVNTTFVGTAFDFRIQVENGTTRTDWTPYSNICPISGWDEVEVWNDPKYGGTIKWNQLSKAGFISPYTHNGVTWVKSADEYSVTASGTVAGYSNSYVQLTGNSGAVVGHKYYICSGSKTGKVLIWYNGAGGIGPSVERIGTITAIANGFYLRINGEGVSVDETVKPQIFDLTEMFGSGNEPSTVEEFKALFPADYYPFDDSYTETCVSAVNGDPYLNYTIQLGQTVYGGTVDAVQGKMVVDHYYGAYNGSENWSAPSGATSNYFVLWNTPASVSNLDETQLANYLVAGGNAYVDFGKFRAQTNGGLVIGNRTSDGGYKFASANELKAYLAENPLQVCYELATPITVDLTPLEISVLTGQTNNIWSDAGDVSVEYAADLKTYIDNKIAAAVAALS